jgi:hypothetical protein
MGLRETLKKDIDRMSENDLIIVLEQIKLLKKRKNKEAIKYSLQEIHEMTASSKTNWSDDVVRER